MRISRCDWETVSGDLNAHGCAVLEKLLSPDECREIAALYPDEARFRSHVHMARHGFGKGEYRYFKYPLPELLGDLRTALYPPLAAIANDWNARMGVEQRYPDRHRAFLQQCHDAGQTRPTPLLLQYVPGDFNCLHQDLYGDLAFPLQVAILLSEPGRDFEGGEFWSPNSARACRAVPKWCRCAKAMGLPSPSTIGRSKALTAIIASTCGTASADCERASATPSESSFTTRIERAPNIG
jgi:hypothetical protein